MFERMPVAVAGNCKVGLYQGTTLVVPTAVLFVCHPEAGIQPGEGSAFEAAERHKEHRVPELYPAPRGAGIRDVLQ
jgi:hypothetical protein